MQARSAPSPAPVTEAGDDEIQALRQQLVDIAEQRREVHAFRQAELGDIMAGRKSALTREQNAVRNCSKRVAELADTMAREAVESELSRVDDDEAELAELNALRMQVSRQEAAVKQVNQELASKQSAARAVGEEYESALATIERIRAGVEDERAADEHEEAQLSAQQARLLRDITAATRGATSRLESEWERRRAAVAASVADRWRPRLDAVTGSADTLRAQLAAVASEARGLARDAAAEMAASSAAAFEAHAAPLCRQLDAEASRLGSRMAATSSARSRLGAAMEEARAAGPAASKAAARSLGRVVAAVERDVLTVDACDPATGGAGAAFTAEARSQLAAVRSETLRHWEGLGERGRDAMLPLAVALASTAGAHEPPGARPGSVAALSQFHEALRDEARRAMRP